MSVPDEVPFDIYLAVTKKKAQYGRCLDTKQWDQFQQLALPTAKFRFYNADNTIISRDGHDLDFSSLSSFIDWFSELLKNTQTLHMFGPPEMSLRSKDEVSVFWSMEDQLCFQGDNKLAEMRGGGYYHEIWVRQDASWWLKDLRMTRTYVKVIENEQARM